MKVLKVRRLGDSNIVVLQRKLEGLGYIPGCSVVVRAEPSGDVRITPAENVDRLIANTVERVAKDSRRALDILANHDRDDPTGSAKTAVD